MFPYPSGAGLHVGHPLGYIGTDVYARFMRMKRPQRAARRWATTPSGSPPSSTRCRPASTRGPPPRRTSPTCAASCGRWGSATTRGASIATTDVDYYRWTQWIFLQLYGSWYDDDAGPRPARSPSSLERVRGRHAGAPESDANPDGAAWRELDGDTRRAVVDSYRLAYLDEALVNWCPALGTVLANEEVTPDGRSERGNHPVFRRPLKQWMLRITAYADRLLADLDLLDWPESIKLMQRNWIGRSVGAEVALPGRGARPASTSTCSPRAPTRCSAPPTWCSRPSTRWSTRSSPTSGPTGHAVRVARHLRPRQARRRGGRRRTASSRRRSRSCERQAEGREKTGVFTGAFANNPTNGWSIPVFIADYVLMGYGTGAIMAVPAHDQRDFEFADEFDLPIVGRGAPARRLVRERVVSTRTRPPTSGPRPTPATASA